MDYYFHWRRCLETGERAGTDEPVCGFWRKTVYRGSGWVPLAVYYRDAQLVVIEGEFEVEPHKGWTPFAFPISEIAYRKARRTGSFVDEFEHRDKPGTLTTDLRHARPVMPLTGAIPHGRNHTK